MKSLLRMAVEADAAAIRAIYTPYCNEFVTSFELAAPSVAEMQARLQKIMAQYPWLVCERDGRIVGYAYACPHRERAAYRWSVDAAVYIAADHHRLGIGRALYTALFRLLAAQGYFKAYAGITLPNPGSVGLHEAVGFGPIGVYRGVGYKLGAWRDVGWWQMELQPEVPDPTEPRRIQEIVGSAAWHEALAAGTALLRG
jgi:L-amino acid N-acyltransferase YncA